ncbi:MAG: YggS family pyridoxal phosphate-dependent enzyme [Bacilli bacterium]|jgi:pyridoxal phosphate enzyme (YggS family)|nr:YggS family pyridoxal phosphate-dependent enzyme [Acholeplasmataceae bacterium]HPZ27813.1 YggS family pyridoxal phosphate-dependent enzyme [Bacilli bacterium]
MSIKEQVRLVRESLRDYPNVQIIAATKYMDIEQTQELIDAGIYDFGENRADEFLKKYNHFKDYEKVRWHYFGVVQNRKIKDLANRIVCLHSLERLATAIEFEKRLQAPLDCFVQVNISEEANKQGIPANKVKTFIKQLENCKKIRVIGLMCIAPLTFDEEVLRKSFQKMQRIKEEIESMNIPYAPCHELSMGMSNDYKIAVQHGATRIRLGRIFLI